MNLSKIINNKFKSKYKFTFSIIIAVYNAEKYLDETIQSILSQSFKFNKVQVILVDDGSTDGSMDICNRYVERYPENFIYLYQKNQGQSVARNNGLNHVEGRFVNFLDSDDLLETNALKDVYQHFKSWGSKIDVISIPRFTFGRVSEPLKFYDKYMESRVVDILKEYDFPQVSVSASFIRTSSIEDKFNRDLVISEDSLFLNKIILKKCRFGVVGTSRYMYRKREDEDSTIDTRKSRKEYFTPRMEMYFNELILESQNRHGKVLKYIQNVLLYDLYWMLTQNSEVGVLDDAETEDFYEHIHDVFQYIDDDVILSQSYRKSLKYHMLSVKYGNEDFDVKDDILQINNRDFDRLANYAIHITDIKKDSNNVKIDFYYEFYPIDFGLKASSDGREYDLDFKSVDETISMGRSILDKYYYSITLGNEKEISFKRMMSSDEYPVRLMDEAEKDGFDIGDYSITIRN